MPDNATENTSPKRPFGRTLSDLWLDSEEGKLHPAEWKLLECAARGEWCELGDECPAQTTNENRIRSEVLRFVALGGDDENPVHEHGLQLIGAAIECTNNILDLEGATLPENISVVNSQVNGAVTLEDALAETISFAGSSLRGLFADRLEMTGNLELQHGFSSSSTVRLVGASLGGDLRCANGRFNDEKLSIYGDSLTVNGDVLMADGYAASGKTQFSNAKISGDVDCRSGQFRDTEMALSLQGSQIDGTLYLSDGFAASGSIDLSSVTIGANLHCTSAQFLGKGQSIHAPRTRIGGNVNLGKECKVAGQVSFHGAAILGDVMFTGGSFEGKPAVNLKNSKIDGILFWRDIEQAAGELNLTGASCLTINMDKESWEKPEQIRLDAFTYSGFSELPEGCDSEFWKAFLERQPDKHLKERFRPNPYTQLANVLENMGHEQEAVAVRIEQRRRQCAFTKLYEPKAATLYGKAVRRLVIFWNFMQGLVVDYGYRPGKALLYLFGIVIAGAVIYQIAAFNGIMTPTHPLIFKEAGLSIPERCARNWVYPGSLVKDPAVGQSITDECEAKLPSEHSTFNALIYSADVALPIVNFRMEVDWAPRVVNWKTGEAPGFLHMPPWGWGWWVRTWEWVQIALGWLLSLLFASAIGGIIRR